MIKTRLKRLALWLGLLLCGYALWRTRDVAGDAIGQISLRGWVAVILLLAVNWGLAVVAWRQYLRAYTSQEPGWSSAMRQSGLLLIGKYIPGGVFGFLARLYDPAGTSRRQLLWAGLAEQTVGVAMPLVLGGILYAAAALPSPLWMVGVVLLPPLAIAGIRILHRCAAWIPLLRRHVPAFTAPAWQELLLATSAQLLQVLSWAALVAMLAHELYGMNGSAILGVAGAFLIAVAAGMLIVLAPGGIGVREATLVTLASYWLDAVQAIFLAASLRLLSSLLDAFAGGVAAMIGVSGERK